MKFDLATGLIASIALIVQLKCLYLNTSFINKYLVTFALLKSDLMGGFIGSYSPIIYK